MMGVFMGLSWGSCIALLLYTLAQRLVWVGSLMEVMIRLHSHLIFLSVYPQAVLSRVIRAPSSPCITIPASPLCTSALYIPTSTLHPLLHRSPPPPFSPSQRFGHILKP